MRERPTKYPKLAELLGLSGREVATLGEVLDKVHEVLQGYRRDIEELEQINGHLRWRIQQGGCDA